MLAEAAVAHVFQGVEGAYRRTDPLDERAPVVLDEERHRPDSRE